jgi:hypothetical protein
MAAYNNCCHRLTDIWNWRWSTPVEYTGWRFRVVVFCAAGSRQAQTSQSTLTQRTGASGTPSGLFQLTLLLVKGRKLYFFLGQRPLNDATLLEVRFRLMQLPEVLGRQLRSLPGVRSRAR